MIIRNLDSFISSIQQVEEELLYPQVKEYAENDEVKKVVEKVTEPIVEYSFTVFLKGTDEPKVGKIEAVSFADANVKLIYLLKFVYKITFTYIDGDKRYNSFVVYETNGRRK